MFDLNDLYPAVLHIYFLITKAAVIKIISGLFRLMGCLNKSSEAFNTKQNSFG